MADNNQEKEIVGENGDRQEELKGEEDRAKEETPHNLYANIKRILGNLTLTFPFPFCPFSFLPHYKPAHFCIPPPCCCWSTNVHSWMYILTDIVNGELTIDREKDRSSPTRICGSSLSLHTHISTVHTYTQKLLQFMYNNSNNDNHNANNHSYVVDNNFVHYIHDICKSLSSYVYYCTHHNNKLHTRTDPPNSVFSNNNIYTPTYIHMLVSYINTHPFYKPPIHTPSPSPAPSPSYCDMYDISICIYECVYAVVCYKYYVNNYVDTQVCVGVLCWVLLVYLLCIYYIYVLLMVAFL